MSLSSRLRRSLFIYLFIAFFTPSSPPFILFIYRCLHVFVAAFLSIYLSLSSRLRRRFFFIYLLIDFFTPSSPPFYLFIIAFFTPSSPPFYLFTYRLLHAFVAAILYIYLSLSSRHRRRLFIYLLHAFFAAFLSIYLSLSSRLRRRLFIYLLIAFFTPSSPPFYLFIIAFFTPSSPPFYLFTYRLLHAFVAAILYIYLSLSSRHRRHLFIYLLHAFFAAVLSIYLSLSSNLHHRLFLYLIIAFFTPLSLPFYLFTNRFLYAFFAAFSSI